jgi:3-hydroxyacyl-CoA dehydrogenase
MFAYVSNRIPEISDELYKIDDAMKAGFGWKMDHLKFGMLLVLELKS